jgi:hypothetical protein
MFSCAGRTAFFGGMIVGGCEVASSRVHCREIVEIEMFVCAALVPEKISPEAADGTPKVSRPQRFKSLMV